MKTYQDQQVSVAVTPEAVSPEVAGLDLCSTSSVKCCGNTLK